MPETYNGVVIPSGGDLAYAPRAFKDGVDNGNFVAMFPTVAGRDAWVNPVDGAMAYTRDTNVLSQRVDGIWRAVGSLVIVFTNAADRDAKWPSPPDGALAITGDNGILWVRRAGAWQGLVVNALTVATDATVAGNLTVTGAESIGGILGVTGGINCFGVLTMPQGHTLSSPDAATLRMQTGGGGVATLDVEQNRVRVTNQPIGNNWDHRALVLQKFAGAGEVGLGFFNHMSATGGSMQLYTPPAGATEFYFVNANNSGGLGLRAAAFNTISSLRFKEHVGPAKPFDLTNIHPIEYNLLGEDRRRVGLIAEDVAAANPMLSDGEAIDLSGLVASLVGVLQDVVNRLARLEGAHT